MDFDEDALTAAVDLIGRSGARGVEIGYANNDAKDSRDGDWYAICSYIGVKLMEEHHSGPVQAADALARRLLTGAKCMHCGGLVALSDRGAYVAPGAVLLDGTRLDAAAYAAMSQCRWRRLGDRWERGCANHIPDRPPGPTRRERRSR